MMRIGQSTDIHQLAAGRRLVLGGVEIPYAKGLVGHSDADVLTHAITEAIIGALGLGDLGTFFPDSDDRYKDICSLLLLDRIVTRMEQAGYAVVNVDSLVLMESPRLHPHIQAMRECLASHLHCTPDQVNVKATTGEKLGFVGQGLGVEAQAVVLLDRR